MIQAESSFSIILDSGAMIPKSQKTNKQLIEFIN